MAATGKDHARVNLEIWGDDDWLDCSPAAQHLYLVLWTSPGLSYCGAGEWHPGRIAARAKGWSAQAVMAAGVELSRDLFLLVDEETGEFLLRSWLKHDGLWKVPNMAVSMANARAELASRPLRGVVVHEALKVRAANPGLSSWEREAVVSMLGQRAVDPADVEPYNPSANPSANPWLNPSVKGSVNPSVNSNLRVGVNPASNPGPTPAPSPTPSLQGGYVGTEGDSARDDEPPSIIPVEPIRRATPAAKPDAGAATGRTTGSVRWQRLVRSRPVMPPRIAGERSTRAICVTGRATSVRRCVGTFRPRRRGRVSRTCTGRRKPRKRRNDEGWQAGCIPLVNRVV